ncbi:MAG: RrF2 family transcriptional regulator [Ancrocorticia sp.]|uniref:RrF2 family transcriptional regulator n=2 Tax=Ancrocorticia sp. TaxID=2593684 RepID=UPI003F8EFB1F
MLVSTKGRYALRVMIDLAENQTSGYIPLKEIAERQDVSEKYLESILKTLVRSGALAGQRGKGGGYRLTQDPAEYTVATILHLTEGSLAPVAGLHGGGNSNQDRGATLKMWHELDELITAFFEKRTIADLASSSTPGDNYVI